MSVNSIYYGWFDGYGKVRLNFSFLLLWLFGRLQAKREIDNWATTCLGEKKQQNIVIEIIKKQYEAEHNEKESAAKKQLNKILRGEF